MTNGGASQPSGGSAKGKKKTGAKKKKPGADKPNVNGDSSPTVASNTTQLVNGNDHPEDEELRTLNSELPTQSMPQTSRNGLAISDGDGDAGPTASSTSGAGLSEKLDALAEERDILRREVAELRQSLEDITSQRELEVKGLREEVDTANEGREEAEQKHAALLERVNSISATLGERLKSNAEEISQANVRIEELQEQNLALEEDNKTLEALAAKAKAHNEQQAKEIDGLRGRANISQQNWIKERDDLISREALARDEYESTKQAMQDWEVLAMEERSQRESLSEKVAELEHQLATMKEAHDRAASERDSQSQTVDGLQRALRDIQDARKKELRELVESSEAQLEAIRVEHQRAVDEAASVTQELHVAKTELERTGPFEKEVKEKNVLIGKLRHEGVILNEHFTKALRFIKQRNPEDMVDRQVVTNHFQHFLTLDRSDPKKFQVLQLIAALLGWDDEQREQAGLSRPGGSTTTQASLRVPLTPFRKNSAPSLETNAAGLMEQRSNKESKESLAELWHDFLEREAADGSGSGGVAAAAPRRPSSASVATDRPSSQS